MTTYYDLDEFLFLFYNLVYFIWIFEVLKSQDGTRVIAHIIFGPACYSRDHIHQPVIH
jgi:hypothetical protein